MSTSTTKKTTRPQAFTLIELLVVISIIAILASLAFPAIGGAMDSAKKTTAKNAAVQIANAVVAYETEYGRLPTNSGTTVGPALMSILTAATTNNNPRAIVFLEAQAWKKGKGGTNASGDYQDPWGGTYQILLDDNYDNRMTNSFPKLSGSGTTETLTLMKKVAVWNTNANSKLLVRSWE
jgi:prepilin-type N-terminal cleavage/methylation domain-containing protein